MDIRTDELSNPHIIKLLQAHHNDMLKHSPVESVHALDIAKLTNGCNFFGLKKVISVI